MSYSKAVMGLVIKAFKEKIRKIIAKDNNYK